MVDELFKPYGAAQDETIFKFASDVYADQSTEIDRMQKMLAGRSGVRSHENSDTIRLTVAIRCDRVAVAALSTRACGPKSAPSRRRHAPAAPAAQPRRRRRRRRAARRAGAAPPPAPTAAAPRRRRRRRAGGRRRAGAPPAAVAAARHAAASAAAAAGRDAGARDADRLGDDADRPIRASASRPDAGTPAQAAWNMRMISTTPPSRKSLGDDALGSRVHAASTRFRATTTASRSTTSRIP